MKDRPTGPGSALPMVVWMALWKAGSLGYLKAVQLVRRTDMLKAMVLALSRDF